jgi:hypothetical protein
VVNSDDKKGTSFGSANVTRRHATFVKVHTEQMVNLVLSVFLRYTNSDYPFGISGDISRAKTGSFFIIRVHHWGSRWSICFIFCLYVGFFCRPLIAFLFLCRFSCGSRMENPVKQDEDKQIREPQHSTLN